MSTATATDREPTGPAGTAHGRSARPVGSRWLRVLVTAAVLAPVAAIVVAHAAAAPTAVSAGEADAATALDDAWPDWYWAVAEQDQPYASAPAATAREAWLAPRRDALRAIDLDAARIGALAPAVSARGLAQPADALADAVDRATASLQRLLDAVAAGDDASARRQRDALHAARSDALGEHQDLERAMHRVGIGFHG